MFFFPISHSSSRHIAAGLSPLRRRHHTNNLYPPEQEIPHSRHPQFFQLRLIETISPGCVSKDGFSPFSLISGFVHQASTLKRKEKRFLHLLSSKPNGMQWPRRRIICLFPKQQRLSITCYLYLGFTGCIYQRGNSIIARRIDQILHHLRPSLMQVEVQRGYPVNSPKRISGIIVRVVKSRQLRKLPTLDFTC